MKCCFSLKLFTFLLVFLLLSEYVPLDLATDVVPTDEAWFAHPMHIVEQFQPFVAPQGYTPTQIKAAYGLPATGGAGTTIAIISAYDTPSIWNDLGNFSLHFNLPLPTSSNFEVVKMASDLVVNTSWAEETCLDVEWAHAIAPNAKILLVEAKSPLINHLLDAVAYAKNRPDVVAVSMSWGIPESPVLGQYNSNFISNYGAVFFAASGDNGSQVIWPACSPNVVSVGGTTLNLEGNIVTSEIAWNDSGGGISTYTAMPSYQADYGLTGIRRKVPDVSYNANPSTGFPIFFNSSWFPGKIGGTSAGAPQWAAIHALGLSATHSNLYARAKTAYASYFRDITSGSNGYSATPGYDLVTGLGSPITFNFGIISFTPTMGPAGAAITINGVDFTPSSSVNVSWQNPLNSSWTTIANNVDTDSAGKFTLNFIAPDLMQNNLAGDNPPASNNIFFRAVDNSNGRSYISAVPYTEMRRGLSQVADQTATGLYGNNTNLATNVFLENGQAFTLTGQWFLPGTATLFWDGVAIGTTSIDATGTFSASVTVPSTSAGQHTITVTDGATNFCVNVSRLPSIANNYTADGWQTSDITVNLTHDYVGVEIYYQVNSGTVYTVSANGIPVISTEGSNTLEYWGIWDLYGSGNMQIGKVTITGIQLDKTAPTGSLQINGGAATTASTSVTLTIAGSDSASGVSKMHFSNDEGTLSSASWVVYADTSNWNLSGGDGLKTVYCQLQDNAGLTSEVFNAQITLNTSPPTTSPPTPTLTSKPTSTPSSTASPAPSGSDSEPSATPEVPESSFLMILVLLALIVFFVVVKSRTRSKAA